MTLLAWEMSAIVRWLEHSLVLPFLGIGMKIDVFLKFPYFFYNPANIDNLISSSSSFSKPNLDIWKFLVYIMLKPSMQDFKHDLTSMGDECNCPMVSRFFGATLLGDWDED